MGKPSKIAAFDARIRRMKREVREQRERKALAAIAARANPPVRLISSGPLKGRPMAPASPPPEAQGRGVYLLRETGTNFVKIGWTSDFRRRYPSLRETANPRKLIFLGWLSRSDNEGSFHAECAPYSVGRDAGGTEWFEMPEERIAVLVAACTGVPK